MTSVVGPAVAHSAVLVPAGLPARLAGVARRGWLNPGRHVRTLERAIPPEYGAEWGVAASSGTAAVALALEVAGVPAGSGVAVPSYTCRAVPDAVGRAGIRPVVVDNDPGDLGIGRVPPLAVVRGLIQVHQFGFVARSHPEEWAGLAVIHDCCQLPSPAAHGRRFSLGERELAVVSFEGTKPYPAGAGGMVLGRAGDLEAVARELVARDYRTSARNRYDRPCELTAAAALAQWEQRGELERRRARLHRMWRETLAGLPGHRVRPWRAAGGLVPFRFVAAMADAASFVEAGQRLGFRRPVAPVPLHVLLGLPAAAFPVAAGLAAQLVSCPMPVVYAPADLTGPRSFLADWVTAG